MSPATSSDPPPTTAAAAGGGRDDADGGDDDGNGEKGRGGKRERILARSLTMDYGRLSRAVCPSASSVVGGEWFRRNVAEPALARAVGVDGGERDDVDDDVEDDSRDDGKMQRK